METQTTAQTNETQSMKPEMFQEIAEIMTKEMQEHPPTIGLIGVSGVGKSSTINAMFRTRLATSDTTACTKAFEAIDLSLPVVNGQAKHQVVSLRVIDAPGLGESVFKDTEYLAEYDANLGQCDIILWVMSARNRAVALDQYYLQQLQPYHDRMVFGINQADIVEPMDWRENFNVPSGQQEQNLKEIQADRRAKISEIIQREAKVVAYSSKRGYHLEQLFYTMIAACPDERRWIFEGLKNFSYKDFIPQTTTNHVVTSFVNAILNFSKPTVVRKEESHVIRH